jgi:MFS family permease
VALGLVVPPLLVVGAAVVPRRRAASRSHHSPPRPERRSRAVPLLWLVFACGSAPGLAAFAQALDIGASLGLSRATAGWSLVALSAGNLAGRLAAGVAAGRSGMVPALTTCVLAQAVALAVASAVGAGWVVLVALLVVGTCYGGLSALVPAATAEVADPAEFGRVYGRVFTGWGLAGLAAPVLAAHLAADVGWAAALRWSLVPLLAAGTALALLARSPERSGDRV